MTCTFLYHMSVLKYIMHCFLLIETVLNKMYNREMDTAEKLVSYGSTYLLRNGLNSVHMSLTKLKDVTKSAKVCICLSNGLVVYLEFFCFAIKSESIRNESKVRPVPLPFIPLATLEAPKLRPTPEIQLCGTNVERTAQNRILAIARSRYFKPNLLV